MSRVLDASQLTQKGVVLLPDNLVDVPAAGDVLSFKSADPKGRILTEWRAPGSGPALYVLKAGDQMTGPLLLAAAPTDPLGAATKAYVDGKAGVTSFNTRTGAIVLDAADVTGALGYTPFNPATQLVLPVGSPTSPAIVSNQDADTGYGWNATGTQLQLAVNGVNRMLISANSITLSQPARFQDGTAAAPAMSFTSDTGMGVYKNAAGILGFTAGAGGDVLLLNNADLSATFKGPAFLPTGSTAVTQAPGNNSTQLATTAFVMAAISGGTAGVTSFNARTGAVTLVSNDVLNALAYTPVNRAGDVMTGVLQLTPGSAAAPALLFDPNGVTGIYGGASTVALTIQGTARLTLLNTTLTINANIRTGVGSAAGPVYSFTADTGLGMYRNASGVLGFAVGGLDALLLSATAATFTAPITLPGNASTNLQAVPLQQVNSLIAAIPAHVLKAGDTMTGALTIAQPGATDTSLLLSKTAGQTIRIYGQSAGVTRWVINMANATAEAGSNAGSDFSINRYNDSGGLIDSILTATRSTGMVQMNVGLGIAIAMPTDASVGGFMPSAGLTVPKNNNIMWNGYWSAGQIKAVLAGRGGLIVFDDANYNFQFKMANTATAGAVLSWTTPLVTFDSAGTISHLGEVISNGAHRPGNLANFYITVSGGQGVINWNAGNYMYVDRPTNEFRYVTAASNTFTFKNNGDLAVPGTLGANALYSNTDVKTNGGTGLTAQGYWTNAGTNFGVNAIWTSPNWGGQTVQFQSIYVQGIWAGWRMSMNTFFFDFHHDGLIQRSDGYTANWTAPSDARIKQNVAPTTVDALDLIRRLPIVGFEIVVDAAQALEPPPVKGKRRVVTEPKRVELGWVAQEIGAVIPAAEIVNPAQIKGLPADLHAVDGPVLIPYLVRALQQVTDKLEALERKLPQ